MGEFGPGPDSATVTLTAFDAQSPPQPLGSQQVVVIAGAGISALLQVTINSPQIAFFEVTGEPVNDISKPIGIDDLEFDVAAQNTPDFALSTTAVTASGTPVVIQVSRFNGSFGRIRFVAETPMGVVATFTPQTVTTEDSTQMVLTDGKEDPEKSRRVIFKIRVRSLEQRRVVTLLGLNEK